MLRNIRRLVGRFKVYNSKDLVREVKCYCPIHILMFTVLSVSDSLSFLPAGSGRILSWGHQDNIGLGFVRPGVPDSQVEVSKHVL